MPSTSLTNSGSFAGITILPGLQISPFGAQITNLKAYNFSITDTGQIATTSTEKSYSVSGLSTNDIPLSMSMNGAPGVAGKLGIGHLRVISANTLGVQWEAVGTTTSDTPAATGTPSVATLFTISYANQSSSTTT